MNINIHLFISLFLIFINKKTIILLELLVPGQTVESVSVLFVYLFAFNTRK